MFRIFFFLLGFGFSVIGMIYIILYSNLLTMGYSLTQYLKFLLSRFECIIGIFGFIIVTVIIFYRGDKKNDIYI